LNHWHVHPFFLVPSEMQKLAPKKICLDKSLLCAIWIWHVLQGHLQRTMFEEERKKERKLQGRCLNMTASELFSS